MDPDSVSVDDFSGFGEIKVGERDLLHIDVLPDIQLGPVRERKDPDALTRIDFGVVEAPQFGALVFGVPAVELVPEREKLALWLGTFPRPGGHLQTRRRSRIC